MTVKQLKKDVEILDRALNLGPEPEWKKRHEEINRALTSMKRVKNALKEAIEALE